MIFELAIKYAILNIIAVLGAYFVLRRARFPDFGILASALLGYCIPAFFDRLGFVDYFFPIFAFIAGLIVGLTTSFIHYKLNVHTLISGICSLFIFYSLCYLTFPKGHARYTGELFNNGFGPLSSNLLTIIVCIVIYFMISFFLAFVDTTFWGVRLRASTTMCNILDAIHIKESTHTTYLLCVGNGLISLNSSLNYILNSPNADMNTIQSTFQTLVLCMTIGLVIWDFIYPLLLHLRIFKVFFSNLYILHLSIYSTPIIGSLVYSFIYQLSFTFFHSGYNLNFMIAILVITLLYIANKTNLAFHSKLIFRGM